MKVYNKERPDSTLCVLALGSFDTIHIGHRQLIWRAKEHAWSYHIPVGVYMFQTRPAHILRPDAQDDVYAAAQREAILRKIGVDFVFYETFDAAFMQKTPEEFVRYLKEKLHVNTVVAGFNYRFGKDASGDSALLMRLCRNCGMEAIIVPAVCDADGPVSSTRIRNLLAQGDVESAGALLGRTYTMEGLVQKDRGVGHTLGFPTANLTLRDNLLLPKDGVYMTVAVCNGRAYAAVTNIGIRPTYGLSARTVETHLIGYDGDLYGKPLELKFCKRLRDECAFSDAEALKAQILQDVSAAKKLFSEINLEKLKN